MKSIAVIFLLVVTGTMAKSFSSDIVNDAQVASLSGISEGRAKRADNPTMTGLLDNLLNGNGIAGLQKILTSITRADVKGVLEGLRSILSVLNNIPLLGPVLQLLENILSLSGNLLDRVVNLILGVLRCVADELPKLLL